MEKGQGIMHGKTPPPCTSLESRRPSQILTALGCGDIARGVVVLCPNPYGVWREVWMVDCLDPSSHFVRSGEDWCNNERAIESLIETMNEDPYGSRTDCEVEIDCK